MMKTTPRPRWAFELWCSGLGDEHCASDGRLPIRPATRLFWAIRGAFLTAMFGWWRYA